MSKTIAIIPARGNSKGVPGKNIKLLAGKPMIRYTIDAALAANMVDQVYVSTEDSRIKAYCEEIPGVIVHDRPAYLSQDFVQVDDVALELGYSLKLANESPATGIILQPTSPLRTAKDIDGAILAFFAGNKKTVIGATPWHGHIWAEPKNAFDGATPVGHDPLHRMGRQWEDLQWKENGAIYVFDFPTFLLVRSCRFPPYQIYPMSESVDINTMEDFRRAEEIISNWGPR